MELIQNVVQYCTNKILNFRGMHISGPYKGFKRLTKSRMSDRARGVPDTKQA